MSTVRKPRAAALARSAAAGVLFAVGVIGSAYATERSAGPRWVPDSSITVAVTARLAAQRFSEITHLRVQTEHGGVVSLSGNTGSRREAAKAVSIARGIEGVLRVDNHIVVGERTR
ncbi:MAG TPA: BON domain-containing protein [Steroidobacteraceae bacterium]|nr:BON domain-containing protein [Steroidobacteraceae bacterium]